MSENSNGMRIVSLKWSCETVGITSREFKKIEFFDFSRDTLVNRGVYSGSDYWDRWNYEEN